MTFDQAVALAKEARTMREAAAYWGSAGGVKLNGYELWAARRAERKLRDEANRLLRGDQ